MGWFNKKQGGMQKNTSTPPKSGSLPELPKLPELPELPTLAEPPKKSVSNQLPKIPNNSFGKKFSQNTIKDAVKGTPAQKFDTHPEEEFQASKFPPMKSPPIKKTPKPLPTPKFSFPKTKEVEPMTNDFSLNEYETSTITQEEKEKEEFPEAPEQTQDFSQQRSPIMRKEPVFIRIDKFEEALKTFDKTKKEILEIEKVLHDIAQVRDDEDKELERWQNNIVRIKDQVEKVDKDIFSRV